MIFCHPNKSNKFGYANIIKKRGSKVAGAIWEITKEHEKILDNYEQFPNIYKNGNIIFTINEIFHRNHKILFQLETQRCFLMRLVEAYQQHY